MSTYNAAAQRKYWRSAKGKACRARYNRSLKAKVKYSRYNRSAKGKARHKRHKHTPTYREAERWKARSSKRSRRISSMMV